MKTKLLIIVIIFCSTLNAFSQSQNFWSKVDSKSISKDEVIEYTSTVKDPEYFSLEKTSLENYIKNSPDRFTQAKSSIEISLPNPDGEMDTFKILSTQTMSKALASKFPGIKSYVGYNIADKSHTARITLTPQGFYGMTLGSEHGQTFINPYAKDSDTYILFSKKNAYKNVADAFECHVSEIEEVDKSSLKEQNSKFIDDGILRKYRLGVATTVEYSDFHLTNNGLSAGDTSAQARATVQSAIVVTIDRVNQIFERDLGVTLELIPNNEDVIQLGDASTDPYTNNSGSTMLSENQGVFNTVIGSANYDIGHVFSTGGGGIAYKPSVCSSTVKAGGVTGLPSPIGEPFNIDYVAHEMGHQFGANHTQNNSCQRVGATAMEPGSANTIMGYAGICAPNVQNKSDAMFHYISISEISNWFNGITGTCDEPITIANSAPSVQTVANYIIPQNTPFNLEATATDAEGDALTYSWEQLDSQVATMPPVSTATGGPSFRTFLPSSDPVRYFPAMNTLLNNTYSNTWEVLPTVARTLNFGVVVRDNNALGGQVSTRTTTLTVDATAGPFRVSSQTGNGTTITWGTNTTQTITWDVANTSNPSGINAQNVDILLSTDNGQNFDIVLASNTANDGSKDIVVPYLISSISRLMVKASDNIFFDLNEANINIVDNGTTCITSQNIEVSNITGNSVDISWTASASNPTNGYQYVLVSDGSTPNAATSPTGSVGAGITTASATGLSGSTTYEVYVRSNCGGEFSVWSTSKKFTTKCSITTAPYVENFDGTDWVTGLSGNINSCWSRTPADATSSYAWSVNSGSTSSTNTGPSDDVTGGGKYLYTEATFHNLGDTAILTSPDIDLSALTVPVMKISYHMFGSNMGSLSVQVKEISASTYSTVFSISGQQQTINGNSFTDKYIDLTAYAGQSVNIRFVGVRGNGANSDMAIDQFVIEEFDCLTPLNLSTSNLTSNSIDLSWEATLNESNGYEWVVMASGAAPDTATAVATGTTATGITSATITGLNPNTDYDLYLRANCGLGDLSSWTSPLSFTTLIICNVITAPLIETFNGADWITGLLGNINNTCWSRTPEDATSNYTWSVNSGSTSSTNTGPSDDVTGGGKYLYTEATGYTTGNQAVLTSPDIDLSALTVPRMKISYHMFGSNMGSLSVQVKEISALTYSTVFSISGQQQTTNGDTFTEQSIDLSSFAGNTVSIRIVALRGNGANSDIAIDQFVIEELSDCLTPLNLSTSNLPLNTVDLSWDATLNTSNTYEWVIMPSGVTPDTSTAVATGTTASGTTTAQATGLSVDTNYDAYVRSNCGGIGVSNWSTVSSFFTGYCAAGATDTQYEKIGNVTLNTINNNSTSTGGYEDFTAISTSVYRGQTYAFNATHLAFSYPTDQVIVWIDFNQDLDFEDSGEQVLITPTSESPWTGDITIPAGAVLGETIMRVRLHDTGTGTPNATPCGNSTYGQVEDYTVNITSNVSTPCDATALILGDASTANAYTPGSLSSLWFSFTAPTSQDIRFTTNVANAVTFYSITDCTDSATYTIVPVTAATSNPIGDSKILDVIGLTAGDMYYIKVDAKEQSPGLYLPFGIETDFLSYIYTTTSGYTPESPNGKNLNNSDGLIGASLTVDDGDATLSTTTSLKAVTVNPAASLAVNTGVTLSIDDALTLKSVSDNYSSLILNGTISGTINYERFVNEIGTGTSGGNDLVAPPLGGQQFSDFATANNGVLAASGDLRAFAPFNNATGSYENYDVVTDASVALTTGAGYRAATTSPSGAILVFSGSAESGTKTINITSEVGSQGKWNLIGNPYPSYLDINAFLNYDSGSGTNISVLETSTGIYGYDGDASNGWDIITLANAGVRKMAPGQGFFVAAPSGGGTLQFTPAMRAKGGGDDFIPNRNANPLIYLKLKLSTTQNTSVTDFYFNENSSLGLDHGYDALTWGGQTSNFMLYSQLVVSNPDFPIGLQSLNTTDLIDATIALGVNASAGEKLTFSIAENNLPPDTKIYLEDVITNSRTLLNSGVYSITPSSNLLGTGRFYLNLEKESLSTIENNLEDIVIYTSQYQKAIVIEGVLNSGSTAFVYDLLGRQMRQDKLSDTARQQFIDVSKLSSGVYIVLLQNGNQLKTQKVVIN